MAAQKVKITLPDGSVKVFDAAITGDQLAASIGPGLAKAALAMTVDGKLKDIYSPLEKDAAVSIITSKDEQGLELLRHDCAHVMAEAVKELWPKTQITIGPVIENGFYYDFARAEPFTGDDLPKIEERMREIVKRDETIRREVWDRDKAVKFFKDQGEAYKAEIISDLPEDEEVSLYRQGDFIDLCRGPHLPSTGKLGTAFKLMKVAGAYWRGDSGNEMLTRIYGICWRDKKELDAYLHMLEEAEKRDHRKLGREMDLFHFQEEAPGSVFWHPKGWTLFLKLIEYMRKRQDEAGYVEISTPDILDRELWVTSGHVEKFGENMFYTSTPDGREYALKPMNCPGGVLVYAQGLKSYRDLPMRVAEFGKVHRFEPSGALHGLMRVRAFTQDDAHIYCTLEQMKDECIKVTELILDIYKDFGFEDVALKFSDRPERRIGSDEVWDKSEKALKEALEASGRDYVYNPGEGAFYGPKIDFVLRDAIGRDWQCGTLQMDLNLPERFDISYIGEDGNKHRPVMLHRALFGSLERFVGILLEHYAGRLPLWLAPTQVVTATITSDGDDYAKEVHAALKGAGIRAELDLRNEKINYKVREHSLVKVPVMFVVGKREADEGTVSIRRLGSQNQEILPLKEAVGALVKEARIPS
ncbi:MAG: threonine--tRNA ligase [Proteobacteria bacterium]|nr:threonine--tRNA ligase [Pseudomonadota bacterium]